MQSWSWSVRAAKVRLGHPHTHPLVPVLSENWKMEVRCLFALEASLQYSLLTKCSIGLPWWLRRQRICLQCRRLKFNPCVVKIPWGKEQQPTPVLLPRESHGQRGLAGCIPWGYKESDTTEQLIFHSHICYRKILKVNTRNILKISLPLSGSAV